MRNNSVNGIRHILNAWLSRGERFEQCACNETSLLICHCGRNILVGTEVGLHMCALLLAGALPLRKVRAVGKHGDNILVAFEHLHRQITR